MNIDAVLCDTNDIITFDASVHFDVDKDVRMTTDPLLTRLDHGLSRHRLVRPAGVTIMIVGTPLATQFLGLLWVLDARPDLDEVVADEGSPMTPRLSLVIVVFRQIHFFHYGRDPIKAEMKFSFGGQSKANSAEAVLL